MAIESFPSKAMVIFDIPEVSGLSAKFIYRFFVPDERVNEEGDHYNIHLTPPELADQVILQKKLSRYIEISFSPVIAQPNNHSGEFLTHVNTSTDSKKLISENIADIQSELEIATKGTCAITIHNFDIQKRIAKLMRFSLAIREPHTDITKNGTASEQAKRLNDLTPSHVIGNVVFEFVYDPGERGMSFVDYDTGQVKDLKKDFGAASKRLYAQINDRFVGSIFKSAASNPFGPIALGMSQGAENALSVQDGARGDENPSICSGDEYSTNLQSINDWPMIDLQQAPRKNNAKVIGYVIEKQEILPDGTRIDKAPLIISNPLISSLIDTKVKYGALYSYTVRTILLFEYEAVLEGDDQIMIAASLLSSRPCTPALISCQEFSPPPHPADFTIRWDYQRENVVLSWSVPVTRTRDVKRFQVFRRKLLSDPYELLVEYDFDDSVVLTPRKESPTLSRVKKLTSPRGWFVDKGFAKSSTYIYTLCSIDAHDISSNYSQQFLVSFDEYKNKLILRMISPSGAPKAYPNFYLSPNIEVGVESTSLTIDAMKDSNHKEMTIYFDPEYLTLRNSEGNNLQFIADDRTESVYKLQIINVDRQKSQVLDIKIDDLRTI